MKLYSDTSQSLVQKEKKCRIYTQNKAETTAQVAVVSTIVDGSFPYQKLARPHLTICIHIAICMLSEWATYRAAFDLAEICFTSGRLYVE
jgi:hypothetical protein